MKFFSFYFWFVQIPMWCFLIFLFWFIPWVFLLYSGILIYFPYEANGTSRFVRLTGPAVGFFAPKQWTPLEHIPKTCQAALVASDDNLFYKHSGVNFQSMLQNFKNNQKKTPGEIKNGDSSLTQQIVRNAFLSRNHSDLLKTREVLGALLLDRIMTKEKQLEWYFNIVEFGPHLYGIESASQKYFHISPQQLSTPQCIALVAILPSS